MKMLKKLWAFFMAIVLIATTGGGITPTIVKAAAAPPSKIEGCTSNFFGYDFKITFSEKTGEWLNVITDISVGNTRYTKVDSSSNVWNDTDFYVNSNDRYLLIGEGAVIDEETECVISAYGYNDLVLILNKTKHSASIKETSSSEPTECTHTGGTATCQQKAICEICNEEYGELGNHNYVNDVCTVCNSEQAVAPSVAVDNSQSTYFVLKATVSDYANGITAIFCNDTPWQKTDYKAALNGTQYYISGDENAIYFDKMSGIPFRSGDIIKIHHSTYGALNLKITVAGKEVTVKPADQDEDSADEYKLHVRLAGYFESALVNQKGYDAITGASTGITENKNSNARVEAALLPTDKNPEEEDWKPVCESDIVIDSQNSTVNINEESGMSGSYNVYDSSVTLTGTPKKAGTYEVTVTITDNQGRAATSAPLLFKIYSGEEYLEDQLNTDYCTQTADGKYMYDMEPWAIKNFSKTDKQEVTVPEDIKAWYGSHTSGTYGELGYAISEGTESTQTLIVPSGCNLTFVNMDILSSVRLVVEDGATLVLRDSVVQGIVDVKNGGCFSMNYDDYADGGKFLDGASINGQLILRDGSILKNAKIYSNTNNIANGTQARKNTNPVVITEGNVTIDGQVFIRGDEAPTGTDSATGKSYTGQTGLKVKNGILTLTKDSVLAVYGGGYLSTTSVGGAAVILDNGTISGSGKLIAVGGKGTFDNGGNAVEGTGNISIAYTYLEGGNTYKPKQDSSAGKAITDSITLSHNTNRRLIDGKVMNSESDIVDNGTYWHDITVIPDLSRYSVEENAPGESQTTAPTVTPTETPTVTPTETPIETPSPIPSTPPTEETVIPQKSWNVTYKANTNSKVSGMPSDKENYNDEETVIVKGTPTRTNAFFAGWNTKADGSGDSYTAGKTFKIHDNTTLYAQWKSVYTASNKLQYKVIGTKTISCIGTTGKTIKAFKIPNTITYKGITYKVTSVAKKAFWKNTKLESISIGNNVKTIDDFAFYSCSNMKKVTIGTGLASIGKHVFCHTNKGCTITINSKSLKAVKTSLNHGNANMIVKVPKSKVNAYKKLFSSKTLTVKAI